MRMKWPCRVAAAAFGTALLTTALSAASTAGAVTSKSSPATSTPPFRVKVLGRLSNGNPKLSSSSPTGLPPGAVQSVYNLSGLSPSSGAGAGQIIAIVDAYDDSNALSDLNTFNAEYGYLALSTCTSLTQSGACFEKAFPGGSQPRSNSNWALEEALDIEWAHAEAPAAKIVLVEAASNSNSN